MLSTPFTTRVRTIMSTAMGANGNGIKTNSFKN